MIKEQITEMLKDLNEDFEEYQGTDMLKDHILDSFAIMELIANIEETYEVEIDANDIVARNFETLDSILNLVKKYVGN
jgi:D-alanine--poly(phosphoribitol) ligase subunit 2